MSETTGSLSVERRTVLNASAEAVWALTRDFGGWDAWHPAIQTCDLIEGSGNQPGVVRKLGLGGEATLVERVLSHSDADKRCTNYQSTFQVGSSADGKGEIVWTSTFDADGVSDEEAVKIIAGVYEGGFDALHQHFG